MRVDLPRCDLNTCKYFFDFNCYGENRRIEICTDCWKDYLKNPSENIDTLL